MTEQKIKHIEEQITLAGLLPGVNLDCLPLEESAKLKRAVLDLTRLIHVSGFEAGADYAMNATASDIVSIPTRKFSIDELPASSLDQIAIAKAASEGKLKMARLPSQRRRAKPPSVPGYHWRKDGAGWELRKDFSVEENGVRKRKPLYAAHLSNSAFEELKRQNKGAALVKAIAQWIAEHEQ
ncbi:MAG: hypothetical protein ACREA2_05395 [Blastocatellia bacterium]